MYYTQQHVCERYKSVVTLFDRTQNWTLKYLNFVFFLLEHRNKSDEFNAEYSCINLRGYHGPRPGRSRILDLNMNITFTLCNCGLV